MSSSEENDMVFEEVMADGNQLMPTNHLNHHHFNRNYSSTSNESTEEGIQGPADRRFIIPSGFDSSSQESNAEDDDDDSQSNNSGTEDEESSERGRETEDGSLRGGDSSEDDNLGDEEDTFQVPFGNGGIEDNNDLDEEDLNIHIDEGGGRRYIYDGAQISSPESDILIMSFVIRWGLEEKAIEDLLRLIDCHMPAPTLGSKYLFLKKFPPSPLMQARYFCPECDDLLPPADGKDMNVECECGCQANVNDLKRSNENCFVQLSLLEQIQQVMNDIVLVQQMRKECNESDVISGKVYKRLRERGVVGDDDITLQWNTDGVKPFKSSKVTLYPIQACINELPLPARKNHMLLCGLYYGKGKPDMNIILKPFVDELKSLHSDGVNCNVPNRGLVRVKVHTLLASVDSVARPMLQGIMQYNGRYGCSFCLRKGKSIPRGRGRARVYVGSDISRPRSREQHLRALEMLEHYNATHRTPKAHIQGVRGLSSNDAVRRGGAVMRCGHVVRYEKMRCVCGAVEP